MKGRESGMPAVEQWNSYFNPEQLITLLLPDSIDGAIVEYGTGYGTFTLALSQKYANSIISMDIEPEQLAMARTRAREAGIENISFVLRDFLSQGSGVASGAAGHVLLYNILHVEGSEALLQDAFRVLKPGASLSVLHWRSDIPTPRGPSLSIRPLASTLMATARTVGFNPVQEVEVGAAAPFHYGFTGTKPNS